MPTFPAPSDPKAAEPQVSFEENLRQAWLRYGNLIYALCALVAVGILSKGGWDYLVAQKELGIRHDFAECKTPEAFRAFATKHPGHPLAAAADLRVADEAYAAGRYADATAAYDKAVAELPAGAFQARAKIGLAMAQAQSGRATDAETGLRQLLGDSNQLKAVRCEAGYHLAGLAVAAGRAGEVQSLAEQLMQIDPTSPFAERTFAMRAEMPEPAAAPAKSAITVPLKN
jgi:hypothetical protein